MRRGWTALVVVAGLALAAPSAALEWRGIVEGAYGPTWTPGMRERMLRWMPAHGFNAYVHAPKDDLWQRTLWREPYPQAQQERFAAEVRRARRRGVAWIPNLSPALPLIPTPAVPDRPPSAPLCFSCPEDLQAVLDKLAPFAAAGARTFMISFDDVVASVADPRDVAAYGPGAEGFGKANGEFLTRLLAALRERHERARLLTVGAEYSGTADSDYLRALRTTLHPDVGVMWTGTGVPAEDWPPAAADAYGEAIGRRPLVWDNWTNNDTAGSLLPTGAARIFLGPYRRQPAAARAVDGFFLNPMNAADLNRLPLATAGEWMADPRRYDAPAAFGRAVRELAGPRRALRASLRAFAETSWSNKLDREVEAPTFTARTSRLLATYRAGGRWRGPYAALLRELRLVVRASARLADMPVAAFAVQAQPWLDRAADAAGGAQVATRLLASERPALALLRLSGRAAPPDPDRAARLRTRFREATTRFDTAFPFTYGWRGGVAFEIPPYEVPPNRMDAFHSEVDALDRAWEPTAAQAAASVQVQLDGRPVALDAEGAFVLRRGACGRRLVAIDGAAGRTALRVACRKIRTRKPVH